MGVAYYLVLLARAIAQNTPIIFLDEPTFVLDFRNQLLVFKILCDMAENGKLVVVCMHDSNHVKWFCKNVLILKDGNVLHQGRVEQVFTQECLKGLYGNVCRMEKHMILPIM